MARYAAVQSYRRTGHKTEPFQQCIDVVQHADGEDLTTAMRRACVGAGWTPGLILEEVHGVTFATIPGELPRA